MSLIARSSATLGSPVARGTDASLLTFETPAVDPRWSDFIDRPLTEWGRVPDPIPDEDDGFLMPCKNAVDSACLAAFALRKYAYPSPDDVVPNGDGGIFFHWGKPGQLFDTLEFFKDGSALWTTSYQLRHVETFRWERDEFRNALLHN